MTVARENTRYPASPVVAVGAVVLRDGCVLLIRRKEEPLAGWWAVPGGAVRLGETLFAAAEREVLEETGVQVRADAVVHAFDAIRRDANGRIVYHYVVVDVAATWLRGEPVAADDAAEALWQPLDALDALRVSEQTRRLVERLAGRG